MTMTEQTKPQRYVFVDALRGIAAVAVLLHHLLLTALSGADTAGALHAALGRLSEVLMHGVELFFVISGFVIAHSLRNHQSSGSENARFILRRQVRLDPVYWAALAAALLLSAAQAGLLAKPGDALPGAGVVLANMFYAHRLLGMESMLSVSWTLCIEIQFYLFFMLVLWLCHRLGRGDGSHTTPRLMAVLGVGSLAAFVADPPHLGVTLLPYWCYFVGGYLCYVAGIQRRHRGLAYGFVALFALAMLALTSLALLAGLSAMAAILFAANRGRLAAWTLGRPVQYLGRVSYSLYLIHMPVIGVVTALGMRLTGPSPAAHAGWVVAAGVVSIVASDALYRLVEVPAMRAAAKIRKRGGGKAASKAQAMPVASA